MTFLYIAVYALIYSAAELLPFSGEAHRLFISRYFTVAFPETDEQHFLAFISLGMIVAIIFSYIKEFRMISYGIRSAKKLPNSKLSKRFLFLTAVACAPLFLLLLLRNIMVFPENSQLLSSLCVIFNGIILFSSDASTIGSKTEGNMSALDALMVGLLTVFSVVPGISAVSLALSACLLSGVSRSFSAQFTYTLMVPVFLIRAFRYLDSAGSLSSGTSLGACVSVLVISAAVGYGVIRLCRLLADKNGFKPLTCYCFCMGAVMFILSFIC